jgi:radical SAM protein with 4Fe4S-binding SPASM domain
MNPMKLVKNHWIRTLVSETAVSRRFPIILYFETSAKCNYRCEMCPQSYREGGSAGFMSWETFTRGIHESLEHGRRLGMFFHKRGEPLANPRTIEMIEYACKARAAHATHLSTNGYFLTEELCERLIRSGLKSISISIDATDASAFAKIKGINAFDRVVGNVDALIRLKRAMGSRTPMIRPKFIPMLDNRGQEPAFVERWRQADDVIISDFIHWPKYEQASSPALEASLDVSDNLCTFPWSSLVINYDGSVTMCCNDFDDDLVLGNLDRESLADMWQCEAMRNMRRDFLRGCRGASPICQTCRYFQRRKTVLNSVVQRYLKTILALKMTAWP